MDQIEKHILITLADSLRKELGPYGWLTRMKADEDLLSRTLDDALHLANHIWRLHKRGEL